MDFVYSVYYNYINSNIVLIIYIDLLKNLHIHLDDFIVIAFNISITNKNFLFSFILIYSIIIHIIFHIIYYNINHTNFGFITDIYYLLFNLKINRIIFFYFHHLIYPKHYLFI